MTIELVVQAVFWVQLQLQGHPQSHVQDQTLQLPGSANDMFIRPPGCIPSHARHVTIITVNQ